LKYQADDCKGCPLREQCHKANIVHISVEYNFQNHAGMEGDGATAFTGREYGVQIKAIVNGID
jgi:hypothetical protein